MAEFPDVDAGAISALATSLQTVSSAMYGIELDTKNLRGSVMGHEQWQGSARTKWDEVIADRISDAALSDDVMSKVSGMLSRLATDLENEYHTYQRLASNLDSSSQPVLGGPEPSTVPGPNPAVQQQLDASAARANGLLEGAARQLLGYARQAGEIHTSAATPGQVTYPNWLSPKQSGLSVGYYSTLAGSVWVSGLKTLGKYFKGTPQANKDVTVMLSEVEVQTENAQGQVVEVPRVVAFTSKAGLPRNVLRQLQSEGVTVVRATPQENHAEIAARDFRENPIGQQVVLGGKVTKVDGVVQNNLPCDDCQEEQAREAYIGRKDITLTPKDRGFLPNGQKLDPEYTAKLRASGEGDIFQGLGVEGIETLEGGEGDE